MVTFGNSYVSLGRTKRTQAALPDVPTFGIRALIVGMQTICELEAIQEPWEGSASCYISSNPVEFLKLISYPTEENPSKDQVADYVRIFESGMFDFPACSKNLV